MEQIRLRFREPVTRNRHSRIVGRRNVATSSLRRTEVSSPADNMSLTSLAGPGVAEMTVVGEPVSPLVLARGDRTRLERWARSRTLPLRAIARARIVLSLASGASVSGVARQLAVSPVTVRLWRRRYQEDGLEGLLRDRPGRGRKPAVAPDVWRELADTTAPSGTDRGLASTLGVSPSTVSRWRRRAKDVERTADSATRQKARAERGLPEEQ